MDNDKKNILRFNLIKIQLIVSFVFLQRYNLQICYLKFYKK